MTRGAGQSQPPIERTKRIVPAIAASTPPTVPAMRHERRRAFARSTHMHPSASRTTTPLLRSGASCSSRRSSDAARRARSGASASALSSARTGPGRENAIASIMSGPAIALIAAKPPADGGNGAGTRVLPATVPLRCVIPRPRSGARPIAMNSARRVKKRVFRLSCGRWHRRPSPGGVRLTVSRSLTEAQRHRGAAAQRPWRTNWARNRGDRNCLWPFRAWASVRPGHPSGLNIPQT